MIVADEKPRDEFVIESPHGLDLGFRVFTFIARMLFSRT
jgi:hypothetical protein